MDITSILDCSNTSFDDSLFYEDALTPFKHASTDVNALANNAQALHSEVKKLLCRAPAMIEMIQSSIPEITLQAVLTTDQKVQIAEGALKLMTKKDGSLLANLVNPETGKIVKSIPLEQVQLTPQLAEAATNFSMQMQLAELAEQIQKVLETVEEIRQGQELDRLSTAYSCKQKLLQTLKIKTPELRNYALMRIAMDAEDSRQLLMQSQKAGLAFIARQPDDFWGMLMSRTSAKEITSRVEEIRDNLCALNMVSLSEAVAYCEMGEPAAAKESLVYYAKYLDDTYLHRGWFLQKLDEYDSLPGQYWTKSLASIKERIDLLSGRCLIQTKGDEKNALQKV